MQETIMVEAPASGEALAGEVLGRARREARVAGLAFAGHVGVREAWALVLAGAARLVDVRSSIERSFVGRVPGSLHVAWAEGTGLERNLHFLDDLAAAAARDEVLLMLCRSGKRSVYAAEAAAAAGFGSVFNVLEGFEGERDAAMHRGTLGGWRFHGLPWLQD